MNDAGNQAVLSLNGCNISWALTHGEDATSEGFPRSSSRQISLDAGTIHLDCFGLCGFTVTDMRIVAEAETELNLNMFQSEIHWLIMMTGTARFCGYYIPPHCSRILSVECGYAVRLSGKGSCRIIGFHFLRKELTLMAQQYDVLRKFLTGMSMGGGSSMTEGPIPVTPWQNRQLTELLADLSSGTHPKHITELQTANLLAGTLDEITRDRIANKGNALEYDDIRVYELTEFIMLNLTESFSTKRLAQKAGISESRLKTAFKRIYGYNLFALIEKIRLEKAKLLLTETGLTMEDIAFETGFNSSAYFSVVFKKQFGISPSSFQLKV